MKAAILDDEVHGVEGLVLHLKSNFPEAEIVCNGFALLDQISDDSFALFLLQHTANTRHRLLKGKR